VDNLSKSEIMARVKPISGGAMNGRCKPRQQIRLANFENFRNALAFLTEGGALKCAVPDKAPPVPAAVVRMWLDRAEEMRSFAETVDGEYGKHLLLCVADDFERIAKASVETRASFDPGTEHN
jgi:hypothetical protein